MPGVIKNSTPLTKAKTKVVVVESSGPTPDWIGINSAEPYEGKGNLLSGGGAEEFTVEAEEEVVGHARDVVGDDAGAAIGPFAVEEEFRDRLRLFHVVVEKFAERGDGALAVFHDGRMVVETGGKEFFQMLNADLAGLGAKAGQFRGVLANGSN